MSQSIAFIGTGIMGRPMVLNLLKAGHSVAVPATGQHYQMFTALLTAGRGELDHSGYATLIEDLAGHKVSGGK